MTQPDLFAESGQTVSKDITDDFLPALEADGTLKIPPGLAGLFELSVNACYAALYAVMSELPIKRKISHFIEKVERAGNEITKRDSGEARIAADRAATDRGDPDVLTILKTAGKVQHEIHRLTGLLRFDTDPNGVYIARSSPDYFVLPALASHFYLRFGDTPWAIIDEKRGLCLCRAKNGPVRLLPAQSAGLGNNNPGDTNSMEELWRLYYHSVNIESRKNLRLRRQFMPERYQKYLPELQ